ncbi:MAG: GHKL domain-containing protein [Promethearchaeota archaeon]|nr:MAG: GHKL domain-containing protein [Candidatus Lokiarchaeota archaeon]
MSTNQPKTKYAPAERASEEIIQQQSNYFKSNSILNNFLSKIPAVFIIVNNCRQIVYMNKGALEFTGLEDVAQAIGKRPGEIIGCIHSAEEEGGCGTSIACTYCGAVNAVLIAQKGKATMEDCRLILGPDEVAYDLRVWANPLEINGEQFTAVTIQDIRHEKRRAILERIFFHDILNTVSGLVGTIEILKNYGERVDQEEFIDKAYRITNKLIEEIQSQRLLVEAENKSLTLKLQSFNSIDFLHELVDLYVNDDFSKDKRIYIDKNAENIEIITDRTILRRIMANIIKNAYEAISKGQGIRIGCKVNTDRVEFWVHNPGIIPRDIQLQIFQRSFSTKGSNRGIGTYSMKLLSSFLEGEVSFTSTEQKGTIFKTIIPITLKTSN